MLRIPDLVTRRGVSRPRPLCSFWLLSPDSCLLSTVSSPSFVIWTLSFELGLVFELCHLNFQHPDLYQSLTVSMSLRLLKELYKLNELTELVWYLSFGIWYCLVFSA